VRDAHAYRPFDGIDVDVAEVGIFELELGPAQLYVERGERYLIAPSSVLNYGILRNLELVVDFKSFVGLEPIANQSRVRLLDDDVQVKWLLRRGTLQDESGPSIAIEAGPLLPEAGGDTGFGAQANLIISYRARFGTVHANGQLARGRDASIDLFTSAIVEGPPALAVRPVAEVFFERNIGHGTTYSALLGAIWPKSETFSLDAGARIAESAGARTYEVRVGFTWALTGGSRIRSPQPPRR
jgi:hypothetical protein